MGKLQHCTFDPFLFRRGKPAGDSQAGDLHLLRLGLQGQQDRSGVQRVEPRFLQAVECPQCVDPREFKVGARCELPQFYDGLRVFGFNEQTLCGVSVPAVGMAQSCDLLTPRGQLGAGKVGWPIFRNDAVDASETNADGPTHARGSVFAGKSLRTAGAEECPGTCRSP